MEGLIWMAIGVVFGRLLWTVQNIPSVLLTSCWRPCSSIPLRAVNCSPTPVIGASTRLGHGRRSMVPIPLGSHTVNYVWAHHNNCKQRAHPLLQSPKPAMHFMGHRVTHFTHQCRLITLFQLLCQIILFIKIKFQLTLHKWKCQIILS